MKLFLSRLTLNKSASASALKPLLNPSNPSQASEVHHRLMWLVFSDNADRNRDFLWRSDGKGKFMTLSVRPPTASDLFLSPEIKSFDPNLKVGDKLQYVLRANATRTRRNNHGKSQRVDLVMDMLYKVPSGRERAQARQKFAAEAAEAWMKLQGSKKGFLPISTNCSDYSTIQMTHKKHIGATFGILDLSGLIEISDPDIFINSLANGFGRAKAWGCGLMLIRRA